MKQIILFAAFLFISAGVSLAGNEKMRPQPPKECRLAGYTCILKKVAGGYFWCQKTIRDRVQNSKKRIRVTTRIRCKNRFPVEYE